MLLSTREINDLVKEVNTLSGLKLKGCYQCGKCSASCPMTFQMDYPPHQLIRLAQLGLREMVLTSSTIWVCVSCLTCTARCPKDIDIARLMDVWREIALKEGLATKAQKYIQRFHQSFLEVIRAKGRLYELGLMIRYKLRTLTLLQDVFKAPKLLWTGKLKLWPHKIEDTEAIEKIFRDSEAQEIRG